MDFGRGVEARGEQARGWFGSFPWASVLLFFFGALLLLTTTFRRGREARNEAISELLAEVRGRASGLEGILSRLARELNHYSRAVGEEGVAEGSVLVPELEGHLLDLGSTLGGVVFLDSDGALVRAAPASLGADSMVLSFLSEMMVSDPQPGPTLHTGGAFQDGRAMASVTHSVTEGRGEIIGSLSVLLALDALDPLASPLRPVDGEPTFVLLDSLGHILVHPEREWIGYLYLTQADSLYDPELYGVLPEILGEEAGAWALVSEVLASGSWGSGIRSLLAFSPVRLPDGGCWRLGISVTPQEGILPGLPPQVSVSFPLVLLSLLLMALAVFLPRQRGAPQKLRELNREKAWIEALMNAGADGLLVLSTDQRVVAVNEAFSLEIGWPLEELVGTPYEDLLDRPESIVAAKGRVELPVGHSEARLRSMKGPPLEVEFNTGVFSFAGEDFKLSLIRDVTWRQRVERETLRVGERERLLLGKELHDGLGQHLTGVAFMAKTLARKLVDRGQDGAEEAEEIGQLVKDAVGQIRILSKGLELSEYDARELPTAFEEMAGVVRRLMGVDLEFDLGVDWKSGEIALDRTQATQLYRLCHDVVSEAVRTRLAHKIRIKIRREGDRVVLEIHHDGAKAPEDVSKELNISSYRLRYRARLLDAFLEVLEDPAGGSTTTCSFQVGGDMA